MSIFSTQIMLEDLITSKTRIKLLLKFFLNSQTTAYLRNLETEFGESTNAIRVELNRFEKAGLLSSSVSGNKKVFKANTNHPFFPEIHKLLMKYVGIDQIVEEVVMRVGNLVRAYVTGDFAQGKKGKVIDILLIGDQFNTSYLAKLIQKAEETTSLKIRYITLLPSDEDEYINHGGNALLIWSSES
jgi:predicted transcriptional regulator